MGQAQIVSGGPTGLYNIRIITEYSRITTRLAAIAARLTALVTPLLDAEIAVNSALDALVAARLGLDSNIKTSQGLATLTGIPRWYNVGNGTITHANPGSGTQVGTYSLICSAVVASPASATFVVSDTLGNPLPDAYMGTAYVNDQINFTINDGSVDFETGDAFDIAVASGQETVPVDQTTAQGRVITALADLEIKRRAFSTLRLERVSLTKERTDLQTTVVSWIWENVWCADLTEDIPADTIVGTIEINGETRDADTLIIMPSGAAGLGKMQPTQASTPAAVFVNLAKFPAWQKWKPTYRVGEIKAVDTDTDKCDVCVDASHSSAQGMNINQDGPECSQDLGTRWAGFALFAAENPDNPIITNTADSTIPVTEQLWQDLKDVNDDVNSHHNYAKDIDPNGVLTDKWNVLEPGASGDCDDFALSKLQKLLDKGYPISALKLEGGKTVSGAGHVWLTVQTSEGDYSLDINYGSVMKSELLNYTDRSKQTGTMWKRSGVLLSSVPIEYMDGENAAAFEIGDRVVVFFTGQNWENPKVIGFESNPKTGAWHYVFGGNFDNLVFRFRSHQTSWSARAVLPDAAVRFASAAKISGKGYVFGDDWSWENWLREYTPKTDVWAVKTGPTPEQVGASAPPRNSAGCTVGASGEYGLFNGGLAGSISIYFLSYNVVYMPYSDAWYKGQDLPAYISSHAATGISGKGYIFGGDDWTSEYYPLDNGYFAHQLHARTACLEYTVATLTWATKAVIPRYATWQPAAVTIGGKAYLVGGQGLHNGGIPWFIGGADILDIGNSLPVATCNEYDPVENTWATKTPMTQARYRLAGSAEGRAAYFTGGDSAEGIQTAKVEAYAPAIDTWTNIIALPAVRSAHCALRV